MVATLTVLNEMFMSKESRGMDYCRNSDLLAVSQGNNILLMNLKQWPSSDACTTANDVIESEHSCPTLTSFNSNSNSSSLSHILIADNEGPIDVFDLPSKVLLRSYLEHGSRVTGITWYNTQSYVLCSADGTVRFYKLTDHHSYCSLNLFAGTCGVCTNPFAQNLIAFGTTKGKFYVYDIRNTSNPFIEAKGHLKTVSNVAFMSEFELLTVGTDNTVKLWDLHRTVCTNSYKGNMHQKCFVGLASIDDFIALGSEDAFVRIYNKWSPHCIASKKLCSSNSFVCACAFAPTQAGLQMIALEIKDT